jgi:type II secretion system protein H
MMVVIVVLGIAATVGVISLRPDERGTVAREARRMAGAVEHAIARAQWRAETLGVSIEDDRYRFWRRLPDEGRWAPLTDDDVLGSHAAAAGIALAPLGPAGQPLAPGTIIPLRASGRSDPFSVAIASPNARAVLAVDPLNRVSFAAAP